MANWPAGSVSRGRPGRRPGPRPQSGARRGSVPSHRRREREADRVLRSRGRGAEGQIDLPRAGSLARIGRARCAALRSGERANFTGRVIGSAETILALSSRIIVLTGGGPDCILQRSRKTSTFICNVYLSV